MTGHFDHDSTGNRDIEVPEQWLEVSQGMAGWLREKTGVLGISVGIYPGLLGESGTPALWHHVKKEIIIDPDVALPGQDPRSVDIKDALWHNENPKLFGLLMHETGHAMGTKYSGAELVRYGARPREVDVIAALEEPNAEHRARTVFGSLKYLRHTALELILDEWRIPDSAYGASISAALLLARVDVGVLTQKDVRDYDVEINRMLGKGTVRKLQELWTEYIGMKGTVEARERLDLARRWLALLPEEERTGETANAHLPSGAPSDGSGGLGDSIRRSVRSSASDSDRKFVRTRREMREKRAADTAAQMAEEASGGERRDDDAGSADRGAGAGEGGSLRRSYRVGSRSPGPAERQGMTILAERLEQADFRARTVDRGTSDTPPGRLRHTAMQMEAAVDLGIPPPQTDIFSVRRLRTVHHPPLTVGLMTDVSGSMTRTVEALCTTQWMLSNAVDSIGGRLASMFFGVHHYRGLRVGERHDAVDIWEASDGYERPYPAFRALNHQLDLLHGTGARLLVVATDARWSQRDERKDMQQVMDLSRGAGLHVIWATFTGITHMAQEYRTGAVVDLAGKGPVESASIIGGAAVDLVQRSN